MASSTHEVIVKFRPQLDMVVKVMEELAVVVKQTSENLDRVITSLKEMSDEPGPSDES